MFKLTTQAKDNHGHSYDVTVQDRDGDRVLMVDGAPSGWSMDSIMEYTSSVIFFDSGQDWKCTNIQELLAELRDHGGFMTYDELDRRMAVLVEANNRMDYLGKCSQELERKGKELDRKYADASQDQDDAYANVQAAKKALGEITDEDEETMDDEPDVEEFCPDVDGPGGRW